MGFYQHFQEKERRNSSDNFQGPQELSPGQLGSKASAQTTLDQPPQ